MSHGELKCRQCSRVYQEEKDFLGQTERWSLSEDQTLWFYCSCGAMLNLPPGKYPWYAPSLGMSFEAASAFAQLYSGDNIPYIKKHIFTIQQLLLDADATATDIVEAIRCDPIMAADLMRFAQNLKVSGQQKSGSLKHAVVFLGRRTIGTLVMGAAVKAAPIKTKVFSVESFWKESLTTGAIAEKLVQIHRAKIDPEQAYVAGCFANIGKIIGALLLPDITDKIEAMVTSPKTQCTWLEAEKKHSLYDHSVLGEIGACLWGFSEEHRVVARFHHTPYRLRKDHPSFELCEIIALANQLSHWYSLNPHRVDRALIKQISTKVGLSDTALEGFVNELEISFTDFS